MPIKGKYIRCDAYRVFPRMDKDDNPTGEVIISSDTSKITAEKAENRVWCHGSLFEVVKYNDEQVLLSRYGKAGLFFHSYLVKKSEMERLGITEYLDKPTRVVTVQDKNDILASRLKIAIYLLKKAVADSYDCPFCSQKTNHSLGCEYRIFLNEVES